jgi:hypothetical protein
MLMRTNRAYSAFLLCLVAASAVAFGSPAVAYEDEYGIEHSKNEKHPPSGDPDYPNAVVNMQAFRTGLTDEDSNSNVLLFTSDYLLKRGNYQDALRLIKIAIKKDNDDIDMHKLYAEALEKKYDAEPKKDPEIYNQCVFEWLLVLRQEVGWEKLTKNGIGVPGMGKLFEDEDQVIPARQHLLSLTGSLPGVRENDTKYLRRVMKPTTTGVHGKVLTKGEAAADDKDSEDDDKDGRIDKDYKPPKDANDVIRADMK